MTEPASPPRAPCLVVPPDERTLVVRDGTHITTRFARLATSAIVTADDVAASTVSFPQVAHV